MLKNSFFLILYTIFFLINTQNAYAHKVMVFAWVDGDTIHTESKFSGARKVKQGQINVYDHQGNKLLTGQTNDNGEFSFKIPKRTEMKIELIAGMGHRGEWTIPVDEIDPDILNQEILDKPDIINPEIQKKTEPVKKTEPQKVSKFTSNEIELMMEKTLDKKLKPIIKMLIQSQESKTDFKDIIGGIGYILGIMGIAMYFKARKIKNNS